MRVEDLILKLRMKHDSKLFEKRVNSSSMDPKTNIIEQVVKSHNKN
jgi:hypothetical protein